jgi:hypothetical protein
MFSGSQATKQGVIHRNMTRSNEDLLAMLRAVAKGNAPDFVEVGEAGIAVDHAMRRQLSVQRS